MALTLNGTDQYALRAKSAVNYQTSVYSMFAYVKRDAVDAFAAIFGTDRDSSFRRSHGIVNLWDGSTNSWGWESYTGAPSQITLAAASSGAWVPILFEKVVASGDTWEMYVGNSTVINITMASAWLDSATHHILGAHRDSGTPESFFAGKIAHWAVWEETNLTSGDIADLMDNGAAPSALTTTPTAYEPLISSAGSFTTVGSPTFDADDPIASTPEIRKGSTFDITTTLGTITTATLNGVNVFDHVTGQTGSTVSFAGAATDEITTSGEYSLVLGDGATTETITVQVNVVGLPIYNLNKDGADLASLADVEVIVMTGAAGSRVINQNTASGVTGVSGNTVAYEVTDTALTVDQNVFVVIHSAAGTVGIAFTETLELI